MTLTTTQPRKRSPGTTVVWQTAVVLLVLALVTTGLSAPPTVEWAYYDVALTALLLDDGGTLPVAGGRHSSLNENGGVLTAALLMPSRAKSNQPAPSMQSPCKEQHVTSGRDSQSQSDALTPEAKPDRNRART